VEAAFMAEKTGADLPWRKKDDTSLPHYVRPTFRVLNRLAPTVEKLNREFTSMLLSAALSFESVDVLIARTISATVF